MRLLTSLLLSVLAVGSSVIACSSSSSSDDGGCSTNPFTCPAGQTCAVKDASGTFACLPSGGGAKGSSCVNTPAMTMCGDNLVCLQLAGNSGGQCASYCEVTGGAHPCAAGEQCSAARLQNGSSAIFYLCVGGAAPMDDAGAGDAKTD